MVSHLMRRPAARLGNPVLGYSSSSCGTEDSNTVGPSLVKWEGPEMRGPPSQAGAPETMPTKGAQVTNLVKGRGGEGREGEGRGGEANPTRDVGGAWKAHHHKEKNTTLCVSPF